MQEIEYQKEIAIDVLNKLRVIDQYAFLAGGAVRNWYFNKLANDLDIYIQAGESLSFSQLKFSVEHLLGNEVEGVGSEDKKNYEGNPNLIRVVQTEYRGLKVQIMQVKNRSCILDTFPFGICKCGMDYTGKMYFNKEFYQEVKYRSLVVRNPVYKDYDKYVRKIQSYFPDWMFFKDTNSFLSYVLDEV